jgi:hypothetical protein
MGNQETKSEPPKQIKPSELQTYIMVTQAKLTQSRNKKVELIKKKVKEIIETLNNQNLEIAKAKMEAVLREEDYITVYDILGPLCEILKEKVTYLLYSDKCPEDLRSPVDTIIYASTRIEIDELHKVRDLLRHKFGELFITKANSNADQLVNRNVVDKLKIKPASESLLIARLKQLCHAEGISIEWPSEVEPITNSFEPIQNNINPYNPYVVQDNNQQQDFSGKNLSGMNLSGMNFSNQNQNLNQNMNQNLNQNMNQNTQNPYGGTNYNSVYFQNPYQTYSNPNPNINTNPYSNPSQNINTNLYSTTPNNFPTQSIIVDNTNFNKKDNNLETINQNSNNISSSNVSQTSYSQDFNKGQTLDHNINPYSNPYSGSTNNTPFPGNNPYSSNVNQDVQPFSGNINNNVNPYSGNPDNSFPSPKAQHKDDLNFPTVGGNDFPNSGTGFPK